MIEFRRPGRSRSAAAGHSGEPFISRRGADLRYSSYDVLVIGGGIAG